MSVRMCMRVSVYLYMCACTYVCMLCMAWHGMAWHGMAWHGMAWTVWYARMHYARR